MVRYLGVCCLLVAFLPFAEAQSPEYQSRIEGAHAEMRLYVFNSSASLVDLNLQRYQPNGNPVGSTHSYDIYHEQYHIG